MPTTIECRIEGEASFQTVVLPGHAASIDIYDDENETQGAVMVMCGEADLYSDIFLMPKPPRAPAYNMLERLVEQCSEETFLAQIDSDMELYIDTESPEGKLMKLRIVNRLLPATADS